MLSLVRSTSTSNSFSTCDFHEFFLGWILHINKLIFFYMRMKNSYTSSSWESGQIKTAEDFDTDRMDDNASNLAFFNFKEPLLHTYISSLFVATSSSLFLPFTHLVPVWMVSSWHLQGLNLHRKADRLPWLKSLQPIVWQILFCSSEYFYFSLLNSFSSLGL